MTSVKKRAVLGAIWTITGYGASQVLRFGSNLILTRLLAPEFFGLMAIVNALRMGIELFSDVGISPSIVNNKTGEQAYFRKHSLDITVHTWHNYLVFCFTYYPTNSKFLSR